MGAMEVKPENCATKETIQKGASDGTLFVIDVRGPSELAGGKIEAKRWLNIPVAEFEAAFQLSDEEFLQKYGQPKPSKDGSDLIINCGSGRRSATALAKALEMGYCQARHFPGGYMAWKSQP